MSYCKECNKILLSIENPSGMCRHINTKKHQKKRLENDNKCYNTLLSLVRNNVSNDILWLINRKVINNYDDENYKKSLIQKQGLHSISHYENCNLEFKLKSKYNDVANKQISYNDNIIFRDLLNSVNFCDTKEIFHKHNYYRLTNDYNNFIINIPVIKEIIKNMNKIISEYARDIEYLIIYNYQKYNGLDYKFYYNFDMEKDLLNFVNN
jgi:hypothetical protein